MTRELQSLLEASGIAWCALRNHIPWMAHIIQLCLGAIISSLSVQGHTKSWESHECYEQSGENESTDIGKSHRLRKEGNARISKVSAITPGFAKIIQNVCIWRHLSRHVTDRHIAETACCIDYADTWSLNRGWRLRNKQRTNHTMHYYGCENSVELDTGVVWVRLLITRLHLRVAQESTIQWLQATLLNTGWMDHRQAGLGSVEAIPILDPVDVEKTYGYSASHHHSQQWCARSYGWRYASCS